MHPAIGCVAMGPVISLQNEIWRDIVEAIGSRAEEREPIAPSFSIGRDLRRWQARSAAARIGYVGLQIVRDWVIRFNAHSPDGLLDGKMPGKRSRLDDAQRRALALPVERGPIPAIHGVVRWRLIDLTQWVHKEFEVSLNETTVGRELQKLGYIKLTARPRRHAQNEYALEAFKKGASQPSCQRSEQHSRSAGT